MCPSWSFPPCKSGHCRPYPATPLTAILPLITHTASQVSGRNPISVAKIPFRSRNYLALRNNANQPLFTGKNGRRLLVTSVHAMFERTNAAVLERIGKRVTPHILRHTAATNLLQRGCPVGHIKEILGHQNLETTCRFYLGQLTKAEVRRAFDAYMIYEQPVAEVPQLPAGN